MPIGTSKVGALGGLVPGGTETFNASGTFCVPPGVKKVSITGKGSTGNPGNPGNSGNPGNFATGGAGGGGGGSYAEAWVNPSGGSNTGAFNSGGVALNAGPSQGTSVQAGRARAPQANVGNNFPGTGPNPAGVSNPGQAGVAGGAGNAGSAGSGGSAGNPGNASSGLGYNFSGGAGGNAGAAGNAGTAGAAGGGGNGGGGGNFNATGPAGSAGSGGGNGGAGSSTQIDTPNNRFSYGGGGGGGAGVSTDGNSGVQGNNPLSPTLVNPCRANKQNQGYGGLYPAFNCNAGSRPVSFNSPCLCSRARYDSGPENRTGGNAGFQIYTGQNPGSNPTVTGNNEIWRSGAGGGSGRVSVTSNPINNPTNIRFRTGGGGGGGGRGGGGGTGGTGGAGGAGQSGTPVTQNCVPVTPGSSVPISVATPGGQVVISWNPQ